MNLKPIILVLSIFSSTATAAEYDPEDCATCHPKQANSWQQSDHAKSMSVASDATVLGEFSGRTIRSNDHTARFYRNDRNFLIAINESDIKNTYQISHTFGFYPLQQYLTETEPGRYQVLPYAWDSRPDDQGGQRWFLHQTEQDIALTDRLHWLQPLQNWNGMCADCHSDGLIRGYDTQSGQFNSQMDNINVSCLSCHGRPSDNHATESTRAVNSDKGKWVRHPSDAVAHWQGLPRNNSFMESCFACHSLRSPLTDGFNADEAFLDQFAPDLLSPNLYYPDGQINEEVYVYGSFLQSKMYRAGVNCLDCHDSHTMKLKAEGNALCLQCHSSEIYPKSSHSGHALGSAGNLCVNCHMPAKTYMGVDDRRDHSMSIPRPELSEQFGLPNACIKCHQQQTSQWAMQQLQKLHGPPASRDAELQFLELRSATNPSPAKIKALSLNPELSAIKRSAIIGLLPYGTERIHDADIQEWLLSDEPLIRLAVAQIGFLLPETERIKSYSGLLDDRFKAIRVAAANELVGLPTGNTGIQAKAMRELNEALAVNSWRGEGLANASRAQLRQGHTQQATESLKISLIQDPYFANAYIMLAEIYRQHGMVPDERQVLAQGLAASPDSAELHYAFGLHRVRGKQPDEAVSYFGKAMQLAPGNVQYAYLYYLALDNTGQTRHALEQLTLQLDQYQFNQSLIQLGINYAMKLGDTGKYNYLIKLQSP